MEDRLHGRRVVERHRVINELFSSDVSGEVRVVRDPSPLHPLQLSEDRRVHINACQTRIHRRQDRQVARLPVRREEPQPALAVLRVIVLPTAQVAPEISRRVAKHIDGSVNLSAIGDRTNKGRAGLLSRGVVAIVAQLAEESADTSGELHPLLSLVLPVTTQEEPVTINHLLAIPTGRPLIDNPNMVTARKRHVTSLS